MGTSLVRYEEMRRMVARCAKVDEAAKIRDQASALQAYARQRNDKELEKWFAEIKLRAMKRMGELLRAQDKATPGGAIGGKKGGSKISPQGKSKGQAIRDAGLSTASAARYEQLAGPSVERARKAADAALERYFAESQLAKKTPRLNGAIAAVKGAVTDVLGPQSERRKRHSAPLVDPRWAQFIIPVMRLARQHDADVKALAALVQDQPNAQYLVACRTARDLIELVIKAIEQAHARKVASPVQDDLQPAPDETGAESLSAAPPAEVS